VSAFTAPIICTTGVYEWYYTIGLRTAGQCLVAASFLYVLSALFLLAAVIHAASVGVYQSPGARLLSAGDAFINHHLTGFELAWGGYLVHVGEGVLCIFLGNTVRAFSLNRDQCGLHWYLALSLAALGTASSFAATHIDAFTVYAYLTKDFTAMSAIYTSHQYIAGFFLLCAQRPLPLSSRDPCRFSWRLPIPRCSASIGW
jgi:hypothetical protein